MTDDQGNIITDHEDMADLLKNHWSQVFCRKNTSKVITKKWFAKAYPSGPPCKAEASRWKPTTRT